MRDDGSAPAIKGSVFKGIVEHARQFCQASGIDAEALEKRVGADVAELIQGEIYVVEWYPIEHYGAVRQFLREAEGNGDPQYGMDSGGASARRMIDSGIYPQLDMFKTLASEWRADASNSTGELLDALERLVRPITLIYEGFYNFSHVDILRDPEHDDRLRFDYRDGNVMPYDGRLAVVGFWNGVTRYWSSVEAELWRLEDLPDGYAVRMNRSVREM